MALGEPLSAAAQAVTLSGGNILFDGAAVNGHKTLADAGAVDAKEYHIEIRGTGGWELLRITYSTGSPDSAARPTPLASSNSGSAVTFSGGVEAFYVLPGTTSELVDLLNTTGSGAVSVLHHVGEFARISADQTHITLGT